MAGASGRPSLSHILLPGNPQSTLHAAPKQYCDSFLASKAITAPTAGEDGKYIKWDDASQTFVYGTPAGGAGGSPGGSSGQIQYNSAGSFAGNANLTYSPGVGLTIGTDPILAKGTGTPATLGTLRFFGYDTQNSFVQAVLQNLSNGASASSDFICMTDTGSDIAEYIDMGINNSTYSGLWGGAKDGYLFVDGGSSGIGDLILGTQQANTYVDINVGGGTNRVVRFSPEKAMIITGLTSEPSAPEAGNLTLYAKKVGGRVMPKMKGPSGLDTSLQPNIARNKIAYALPNGNGTTITYLGCALSATGTATALNVATTSLYTQMRGVEYLVTTAATTAVAGFRSAAAQFWRGNAAGRGGFHFICRWGPATGVSTSTNRSWVGLRASTSAPTDVEPSSQVSAIGMGWDAADTNIQIMHNDGTGTATKIDLGASFPVPTADRAKVYELALFAAPNGSSVDYEVTDLTTGAVATGTLSTDLPASTTLLTPLGYSSVGGTSSVIGICLYSLYIETDY